MKIFERGVKKKYSPIFKISRVEGPREEEKKGSVIQKGYFVGFNFIKMFLGNPEWECRGLIGKGN